ncbi:hypothetical protein [Prosthecochloris vibrioformis]|uniref:Uncharacterized protein n=1 Tax=Prosthecochloris vibrioformis TaxID=1098 RepID=A0A5C4S1I4_PROVB|nr:hypothetical protein [Prosthecochloris vibrioformis]TNJ36977.1 hypothetical protein FGF68_05225 [Prosthecochloris vibrioformis]
MNKSVKLRIIIILSLLILTAGLGYYSVSTIRDSIKKSRNQQALTDAAKLLEEGRPARAFDIIRMRDQTLLDTQDHWLNLEIQALRKLGNIERLRALYEKHPEAFKKHEEVSMMIARSLLATGDQKAYTALRQEWENRKSLPGIWFALDVDALIQQGKRAEAIKLLQESTLDGNAEAIRLNRLALLTAPDNMLKAWQYLEQAYRIDPKNPDVRSFRAHMLERMGKQRMARIEYVAAHLAKPENPLYRDQLGEFYRRNGQLALALQTWSRDINDQSADFIRIKALFWSHVATPASIEKANKADLFGKLSSLVLYLQELPEGIFWNEEQFEQEVANREALLAKHQETYWLRILQLLKSGKETEAYDLILSHPFKRSSWNPELERALERVLAFRLERPQSIDIDSFFAHTPKNSRKHQLFAQLEEMATSSTASPELSRLMQSEEAFAAVFMAGGWLEAALQLHEMEIIPADFPEWVAYGITQSLRFNRGNSEALAFARKQLQTKNMSMLMADIMITDGNVDTGIAELEKLAKLDAVTGYRAALILSQAYLEKNEPEKARAALELQPKLSTSITGREIKARILLAEGKRELAGKLYASISDTSNEAKAYLARQAFQEKQWKTARELTLELQQEFPDNMQLRRNLMTISEEEQAK